MQHFVILLQRNSLTPYITKSGVSRIACVFYVECRQLNILHQEIFIITLSLNINVLLRDSGIFNEIKSERIKII